MSKISLSLNLNLDKHNYSNHTLACLLPSKAIKHNKWNLYR